MSNLILRWKQKTVPWVLIFRTGTLARGYLLHMQMIQLLYFFLKAININKLGKNVYRCLFEGNKSMASFYSKAYQEINLFV